MPPIGRVRRKRTFEDLRRAKIRSSSGVVRVAYTPVTREKDETGDERAQVAYAIGRRCGNAVTRNRLRRRLRAVLSAERDQLVPGAYLVSLSPGAADRSYQELLDATRSALAGLHRSSPEGRRPGAAS